MSETKAEVIDPDAPVRFVRITEGDTELALIPWDEAEIIAETVTNYSPKKMSNDTQESDRE